MQKSAQRILPLAGCLLLMSCANTDEIDNNIRNVSLPQHWQSQHTAVENKLSEKKESAENALSVENTWLTEFEHPQLQEFVQQALIHNHQLKMKAFALESAKQSLRATGSDVWPELDLDFQSRRSKSSETENYSTSHDLSLNLSYELDLWGKLSANERNSQFSYLAEKAEFEQQKQQLITDVVTTWLDIVEAESLLDLYKKQAENSRQNISIIEAGYQSGISEALDVYLTRNDLNNELAQIASQETVKVQLIRKLERLLGQYPSGKLEIDAQLPTLSEEINLGLPSELISRKPELKASWYQLLAKDASLAYAHKQRFPSIRFSASVNNSNEDIGEVFSTSALGWSLLGGISQPLFYGGRLEANEERARADLKQSEQLYLDTLYSAFTNVENSLSTERNLKLRYEAMLAAQENAKIAATLSFEQYQSGLVSYTTALDAQTRFYSAQSSLISIKNQLIENRINLHFYLGGDFTSLPSETQVK